MDLIFRYLDRGPQFSDTNYTPQKKFEPNLKNSLAILIQGQLYYMDVDLIFRYLDRGPLFSDTNCTPPKLILHPFNDTK